jgi:hypothetical protein
MDIASALHQNSEIPTNRTHIVNHTEQEQDILKKDRPKTKEKLNKMLIANQIV